MKLSRSRRDTFFLSAMLIFSAVFYLFFAFGDGPYLSPDSETYITMSLHREPLYSLFLALMRALFGPDREKYLMAAIVVQSLLTAAASWAIPAFLYRKLSLPKPVACLLLAMPFAVSLLCRFGAGRRAMYSTSIESEALALPLFLLFFRFLAAYVMDERSRLKNLCITIFFCILLISIRKQMYAALLILMVVLFAEMLSSKCWKKGLLSLAVSALTVLLAVTGLVTTVSMRTFLLSIAALILYAGYLSLTVLCIVRTKRCCAPGTSVSTKKKARPEVVQFSMLVLLCIIVNVAVVSAVIFCQSRYTIYNMPLFYMGGILMGWEAVRES